MAQWFVVIDGVEQGPIDDQGLRSRARAGEVSRETLVRRQDLASPVAAGTIRGLFPPTAPAPRDEGRSKASQPEQPRTAAGRIQELAQGAATLAKIKKLQLHDLPQADYEVGAKAFELQLPEVHETIQEVERLDAEVAALRCSLPAPANESLGDRAKRLALEAKRRVDVERLLQRRKTLLTDAGRVLRENPEVSIDQHLGQEIAAARKIADRIQQLQSSGPKIGNRITGKQLIKYAAVAALALVGFLVLGDVATQTPEERHAAELAQIAADGEALGERVAAEREEETRRREEVEAQRQAELQRQREERQAAQDRRRRDAEEAAQAEAREEERRQLAEEQVAAETEAAKLAEVRRRAAEQARDRERAAAEHLAAQQSREQYAAEAFGGLEFDAEKLVTVAPSAKAYVRSVELRGVRLTKVRSLIATKSWLSLVELGLERQLVEFPTTSEIDHAVYKITMDKYFLLVTTRKSLPARGSGSSLCQMAFYDLSQAEKSKTLEEVVGQDLVNVNDNWKPHPDGKGVVCPWYWHTPRVHLAVLDVWEFDQQNRRVDDDLETQRAALAQKVSLGELAEERALEEFMEDVRGAQMQLRRLV